MPHAQDDMLEKAKADVDLRGAKRQGEASAHRDERHTHFYSQGVPSVLPPLPYQLTSGNPLGSGYDAEGANISRGIQSQTDHGDALGLEGLEISHFLPPPSPPLQPIAEESPVGDGGISPGSASASPLFVADNEDLAPTATVDIAAENSTPVANTDHDDQVDRLAYQLTDQLITFRGCCVDCHRAAKLQHHQDPREHISLAAYLESTTGLCPEVLSSTRIASLEDDLAGKTSSASRQQIYCGLESGDLAPPHLCMSEDERVTAVAGVGFDVDSITGFPSNLAVAKQGIRWYPTQMPVSDLQSGLHLPVQSPSR
ncbi:hypothetical protein BGZ61DRAFT_563322 [Ilyonectria robusta]|uniref:uncharacterized protein n=1 Tax=Ilyonectria robusta TaxID=1079257 RepID=UPI001E8D1068|nr:uncharacterized protein BGZ61DRAFT_563322 [Ilyonectria robusta]KAH8661713.1 hypothetical protein BGZ61DRAFT_563322 [Ilyonectria robusta]